MAGTRIYGQLIRAQLELLASNPSSATGMMYFNTGDSLVTVYDGTGWRKLVTSASIADLSILPIITPAKGGLGADASAWTGVIKAASGVFSAATIVNADVSATAAIDYSKLSVPDAAIPQAKVADLVTDLGNKVDANAAITGDTKTKITYDSKGLVTSGDDLTSDDIPSTLLEKVVSSTDAITGALKLPIGNSTTERPTGTAAQLKGMVRYNDTDDVFEGYNEVGGWSSIGGGGTTDRITQASHGFVVGDVLYLNGSTYAKAKADAANTAEVVGVVSKFVDANQFEITLSGEVTKTSWGLTPGEVYFLSPSVAGALVITEPTVVGHVSLPVGVASSADSLYVAPKRGAVVGSSNARTQIALANNATTTVQNISAYDAGELTGWVSITATTPLRFYVSAKFSKNGAGTDFNISYQTSGDTPPTGFVVTATAAGLLQVTLPSVTGFASASINYALNAPAVGTSFPLSVQSSSIVWSEPVAFRNKIMNGDMRIDQRNSGASTTANDGQYKCDRWQYSVIGSGAFTVQQSAVAPSGFRSSLLHTVSTADTSIASGDIYAVQQKIEGNNTLDLAFGTSVAKSVTLSFWVRSSVVGLKAVSLRNSLANRSYVTTYTINVADTWEYKTINIPGDTTGTWNTDNTIGIRVTFDLVSGSAVQTAPNSWTSGDFYSTSGVVNFMNTLGSTFYITGVQLEHGSVATPFEQKPIGTELALCQRYYEIGSARWRGLDSASSTLVWSNFFKVTKRIIPVMSGSATIGNSILTTDCFSLQAAGAGIVDTGTVSWTANAEL